jgi:hypothetical protein
MQLKSKGDKPWFNYECKVARQNYRKLKRKLKIKRTEALKQDVAGLMFLFFFIFLRISAR